MMITGYFDGACWPNPKGPMGIGALIKVDDFKIWEHAEGFKGGDTSNNVAEYRALEALMTHLIENRLNRQLLTIYGDSNLAIKQMNGIHPIKQGSYVPYAHNCKKLKELFTRATFIWIPRYMNREADKLSKAGISQYGKDRSIEIAAKKKRI